MNQKILRGDIFYIAKVDNGERTGAEIENGRPAVIVSNDKCNEHSPVVEVVYLTTQEKKQLPTHVPVICQVPSTALCEQVFSISKGRLINYIRSCTDEELWEIDKALVVSLGLDYYVDNVAGSEEKTDDSELVADLKRCIEELRMELKRSEDYAKMLEIDIKNSKQPVVEVLADTERKKLQQQVKEAEMQLAQVTGERNAYKSMLENMMK